MSWDDLFAAVAAEATAAGQPSQRAVEAVRLYDSGLTAVQVCAVLHCSTTTLRKLIIEGGGTMRPRSRQLRAEEVTGHNSRAELAQAVVARYRELGRVRGLSGEFKLARSTILSLLVEGGVDRASLGAETAEWAAEAVRMYSAENRAMEEIATLLRVSRHQVRWALHAAGISIRQVGRPPKHGNGGGPLSAEMQAAIAARYSSSGLGMRKVAAEFDVTLAQVDYALSSTRTPRQEQGGRRRPEPLTEAEKAQVRDLYQRMGVEKVAKAAGLPLTMVRDLLVAEGLLDLPGPKNRTPWTAELEAELIREYRAGATLRELQRQYRISEHKLRPVLVREGVLRKQGPPMGYKYLRNK